MAPRQRGRPCREAGRQTGKQAGRQAGRAGVRGQGPHAGHACRPRMQNTWWLMISRDNGRTQSEMISRGNSKTQSEKPN